MEHHDVERQIIHDCRLNDLLLIDPEVELGRYRFTIHGRYRCNMHLAFRFQERFLPFQADDFERIRSICRRTAEKHSLLLSRLGLLEDHLHLVVGIPPTTESSASAISFMNNIAWAFEQQSVLWPSCYIGTIGEYDLGAIH